MADGFEIPIEGDLDPFKEALADMRGLMRRSMAQVSRGARGGRRDAQRMGGAWSAAGRSAAAAMKRAAAGVRMVGRLVGRVSRGIGGMFRALVPGRLTGLLTAGGAIAGLAVSLRGLKGAFDVGGALSDLSARTGIAVRDLALLQQAFEDNGASAESVGQVINKMQRSLSDARAGLATQTRALERMGLSVEELMGLSPGEQFRRIQQAIAGMASPTDRAASAMEIFGRAGADMLTLFSDAGALDKAAVTLGRQAEILDRNAVRFDRISDLLSSAGKKLQGFFVGVADRVAPALLQVLEQLNKVDLSGIGKQVGDALLTVAASFKAGKQFELMKAGLRLAMASAVEALMRGVRGVVAFLGEALPPLMEEATAKMRDPDFWRGVGQLLEGAIRSGAAALLAAAGALQKNPIAKAGVQGEAKVQGEVGGSLFNAGLRNISIAGTGRDVSEVLAEALANGVAAAGEAVKGPAGPGLRSAVEEMKRIHRELRAERERMAAAGPAQAQAGAGAFPGQEAPAAAPAAGGMLTRVVSSLARIGAGGAAFSSFQPVLAETKRQTKILREIAANTAGGGTAAAYQ